MREKLDELYYLRPFGTFSNKEISFFIDVCLTLEPSITSEELLIIILCCFEIKYYDNLRTDLLERIEKYRKGEILCF